MLLEVLEVALEVLEVALEVLEEIDRTSTETRLKTIWWGYPPDPLRVQLK